MQNSRNIICKEQALIFVHIPKTAGTTLSTIITKQYKPTEIFTFNPSISLSKQIYNFKKNPDSTIRKLKLIQGHFYYGLHNLLPQKCTYITFLRDPVDRLISYYYFIRNWQEHHLHQEAMSMSLVDFVCYSNISTWFDNGQTRFISGENPDFRQVSHEMLNKAKKNIDNYFLIAGIQEDFDQSLIFLKNKLQWKKCFYAPKNVNKFRIDKNDLSSRDLKVIENFNELDLELYRYAKNILDQQMSKQGTEFERELEMFRRLNKLYKHYAYLTAYANRAKNKVKLLIRGKSQPST